MKNIYAPDSITKDAEDARSRGDVTKARELIKSWSTTVFGNSKSTEFSISPIDALNDRVALGALCSDVPAVVVASAVLESEDVWYNTALGVRSASRFMSDVDILSLIQVMTGKKLGVTEAKQALSSVINNIERYSDIHRLGRKLYNTFAPNLNGIGTAVSIGFNNIFSVTPDGVSSLSLDDSPLFNKCDSIMRADVAAATDMTYTDDEARERLLSLTSLTDDSRSAAWGWLLSFLTEPEGAHPAIFLEAPYKTGKTLTSEVLTNVFSPEHVTRDMANIRSEGLLNATRGDAIVTIDNIDGIASKESDELSTAVTGTSKKKRAHHKNTKSIKEDVKLGIIFTTTATGAMKSDLQDRLIVLPMEKPAVLKPETILRREISDVLPYARRALLNSASRYMRLFNDGLPDVPDMCTQRVLSTASAIAWVDSIRGTNAIAVIEDTKRDLATDAVPTWVDAIIDEGIKFSGVSQLDVKRIVVDGLRENHPSDATYLDQLTKVKLVERMADYLNNDDISFTHKVIKKQKLYTLKPASDPDTTHVIVDSIKNSTIEFTDMSQKDMLSLISNKVDNAALLDGMGKKELTEILMNSLNASGISFRCRVVKNQKLYTLSRD